MENVCKRKGNQVRSSNWEKENKYFKSSIKKKEKRKIFPVNHRKRIEEKILKCN
jgi:hypothetical protein